MFVQVMEGKVANVEALRAQQETWIRDLAPGAEGWLGVTAGVSADGTFIGLVRFESQEAAMANSRRPEQGAWWEATSSAFEGAVTFRDCPEVDTFGAGGSDDAGFVQIIEGRADRATVAPLAAETEQMLSRLRPDVIGGTVCWPGDGTFVQAVYFSSEDDARAAEGSEPTTEEDRAARDRLMSLMQFDRYIDLREPWLYSR